MRHVYRAVWDSPLLGFLNLSARTPSLDSSLHLIEDLMVSNGVSLAPALHKIYADDVQHRLQQFVANESLEGSTAFSRAALISACLFPDVIWFSSCGMSKHPLSGIQRIHETSLDVWPLSHISPDPRVLPWPSSGEDLL